MTRRVRFRGPDGVQSCTVDELPVEPLDPDTLELPAPYELLLPCEPPEIWCAGVTYERSRDARMDESTVKDVYTLVYDAERPEIFLKDAMCRRTVGPGCTIGVRSDSTWDVPEPEIGLVLGESGTIAGYTIGNDVSSRAIEGENPLYLPQAKLFAGACALGPAVLDVNGAPSSFEIRLRILGADGGELFAGVTSTERMHRGFDELVDWLHRENPVPAGSVLLTGTGLVPPDSFTLEPGQRVEIHVPGIGTLVNPVGRAADLIAEER
ncbi:MAG TPA: fumarylacetoacetate hydrolase family protein [Gaiellaceae bacterium]|nr:fumarylacetoacetate hydrolase family protein [Gaiellaceae bacterium]